MECDICSAAIPFPGMALRYSPAQMTTLVEALGREPGLAVSSLQMQVSKGRFESETTPWFANLVVGSRHMTRDWHLCGQCALAVSRVLDADASLAVMVGAAHMGV
jgi:hypothetical protein